MTTSRAPSRPPQIDLSPEQRQAIATLVAFPKLVQTLGGYAGTGKTTVIRTLSAHLPDFKILAYTGKAASVLRNKGVLDAATIHSAIYHARPVAWTNARGHPVQKTEFVLKNEALIGCEGFIVDEASMVPESIHNDLLSFGKPIIYVGDHGQLGPVGDNNFDLMQTPDITLETLHRNAGEIAHFAKHLRCGGSPGAWKCTPNGEVMLMTKAEAANVVHLVDQVLVGSNRTRIKVNIYVRKLLGLPAGELVVGDRLICLQNDKSSGLFNGQQGIVSALHRNKRLTFTANGRDYRVRFDPDTLLAKYPRILHNSGRIAFAYAYAITVHKAQGDEWPHVTVIEECLNKSKHHRWCYTAASRAQSRVTWVTS